MNENKTNINWYMETYEKAFINPWKIRQKN